MCLLARSGAENHFHERENVRGVRPVGADHAAGIGNGLGDVRHAER